MMDSIQEFAVEYTDLSIALFALAVTFLFSWWGFGIQQSAGRDDRVDARQWWRYQYSPAQVSGSRRRSGHVQDNAHCQSRHRRVSWYRSRAHLPLESFDLESKEKGLFDLSPLAGSLHLKSLILTDSLGVKHWQNLDELTQLESLSLCVHERSLDLAPLHSLSNLTTLKLEYAVCDDLSPLGSLPSLESLEVDSHYLSAKIPPLPSIRQIKLHMKEGCNLFALTHLQDLETLDLSDNEKLIDLNPLASLQNLQTLNLRNCGSIIDLSPLCQMKGLRSINVQNCWRLEADEVERLKTALLDCEFVAEE